MACKHEQLRCTDNVFYCVSCGASWVAPAGADNQPTEAEKPAEAPKRAAKRTTKKRGE